MKQIFNQYNFRFISVLLLMLTFSFGNKVMAQKDASEDLNAYDIAMEHMSDAYEWHIMSVEDAHISVPLPIIVYSSERGWNVFFSNKLHNPEHSYKGFQIAPKGAPHEGKIVELIDGEYVRPTLDISLTKVAFALVFNSFLVVCIILGVAKWYKKRDEKAKAPKGFVGFMEMFIMMIYDEVIKGCIGANYKKFAPFLLTIFFFIFINNLMGLVPIFPGGVGVTGNIAITFVLAIATFIAINVFGTKAYWKDVFWPDVPIFLKAPIPIFPIIEIMGIFTKPFALMVRLFANMMAGHMGILIFVSLIFVSAKMGVAIQSGLTIISVLFTLFMNLLELLVAFIQAYVFTLLSAVFIGIAQESHEPKGEEEVREI